MDLPLSQWVSAWICDSGRLIRPTLATAELVMQTEIANLPGCHLLYFPYFAQQLGQNVRVVIDIQDWTISTFANNLN